MGHRRTLQMLSVVLCWQTATGALAEQPTPAEIRITSPVGGERWAAASSHWVTWDSSGIPKDATVRIDYATDGGRTWNTIEQAAPHSGQCLWKVANGDSETCRLRITINGQKQSAQTAFDFSIVPSQAVGDDAWSRVTGNAAFAARDGAGALVYRGRMWLLGGWNPGDKQNFPGICNNEVWSSINGADWTLDKPNTFLDDRFDPAADWEGRHTAGYVVFKDKMWIVGGDVNQGHYQNDVWNSTDGKEWTRANRDLDVPWGPRALHYTFVFNDRIWVAGGQTMPGFAPSKEVFYRDLWSSSDGVHWEQVVPQEPCWAARGMIGGNVVFNKRMWILGGGTYDTPTTPTRNYYNDVWSSADGVHWRRHVAKAPWKARQYHEVAVFDDRMWVMEGYAGANRNDVWYSTDGVNWYEVPDTPWKPRHAASVFVHKAALWMVAGNNMQPDVWKLQRRSTSAGGR